LAGDNLSGAQLGHNSTLKALMPLTELKISSIKPHNKSFSVLNARGLCIDVSPNGAKLWRFKRKISGKEAWKGIDAWPEVSSKQARKIIAPFRMTLQNEKLKKPEKS
jgi:hypothetical protein